MGVTVAVRDLHDVPQARRAAADTARNAGMCSLDVSIVALVASELATNLARYAPGGTLSSEATGQCVYLESRDAGPVSAGRPRRWWTASARGAGWAWVSVR